MNDAGEVLLTIYERIRGVSELSQELVDRTFGLWIREFVRVRRGVVFRVRGGGVRVRRGGGVWVGRGGSTTAACTSEAVYLHCLCPAACAVHCPGLRAEHPPLAVHAVLL